MFQKLLTNRPYWLSVAYNDVTQARSDFVNKALFTCGSVQPISLETFGCWWTSTDVKGFGNGAANDF
jgi:hypothetical protein